MTKALSLISLVFGYRWAAAGIAFALLTCWFSYTRYARGLNLGEIAVRVDPSEQELINQISVFTVSPFGSQFELTPNWRQEWIIPDAIPRPVQSIKIDSDQSQLSALRWEVSIGSTPKRTWIPVEFLPKPSGVG